MDETLEGWSADTRDPEHRAEVIDHAFDYRGDVTIVLDDSTERVGYVFNRNRDVPDPYLEMFDSAGGPPIMIPYASVRAVRFTGRDTAAGNSYVAWLERKSAAKSSARDA
jgi:hypothetical protein